MTTSWGRALALGVAVVAGAMGVVPSVASAADDAVSTGQDFSPPVLEALLMSSRATSAGLASTVSFRVADVGTGVDSLALTWRNEVTGESVVAGTAQTPPSPGSIDVVLPQAGRWHLAEARVADVAGNWAEYKEDGSLLRASGWAAHALDLETLALTLAPARPELDLLSRPRGLVLMRTFRPDDVLAISGFSISVEPAGVTREVAHVDDADHPLVLDGLPLGVEQSVTVVAHSPTGDSRPSTIAARPALSSNVAGVPDSSGDGGPEVVATKQFGTSVDARIMRYRGNGVGGVRPPLTWRSEDSVHCHALGAFQFRSNDAGSPLCRTDALTAPDPWGGRVLGTRGWSSLRWVDAGYSLDSDGLADVIGVDRSGRLLLYRFTSGRLSSPTVVGPGWQSMISVVSAGDLDGDRKNDVAAVDTAGRLWLYPGNGKGGLGTRRQIGSGWHTMGALLALRDLDRDGRVDLGGITMSGELRRYSGTGTGRLEPGVVIGRGWQMYF